MIQTSGSTGPELPWAEPLAPGAVAFAAIWTTGPDPGADRALRLMAERTDALGAGAFDRLLRAQAAQAEDAADRRTQRELGLTAADLESGADAREATAELCGFLEGATVVVPERAPFEAWLARLTGTGEVPVRVVGLTEVAALLLPGRLASEGARLAAKLTGSDELARRPRAVRPADLRDALAELVGRVLRFAARGTTVTGLEDELPLEGTKPSVEHGGVLGLIAHAQFESWDALRDEDSRAAEIQALALRLVEHPTAWVRGGELFAAGITLDDGRLTAAYRGFDSIYHAVDELRPSWGRLAKAEAKREPFPNVIEEPKTLSSDDRKLVDEILQEHLPRAFAPPTTSALKTSAPSYREGQHQVAAEIAGGFGLRGLQLMHAPTGTGKTLAYLVPTALWALRNGVRVGVATFTRALQEQALDREVPLLRLLLKKAGVTAEPRIALLKGRENYLCWRALRLMTPERRDDAATRLAWATVAGFALTDPDGDLDRLPRAAPLGLVREDAYRRALSRLLDDARSRSGCCLHRDDREDCAGYASRRRAERAHLVVTNHAFALARREFFRHLVFDECEHLHAQAHRAFSHTVALRALRELLTALYKPGGTSRAPLNRVAALVLPESEAAKALARCVDAQEEALTGLDELQRAIYRFKLWREDVGGRRDERDNHSLFREYVDAYEAEGGDDAQVLLDAHGGMYRGLVDLGVALSELAEHLDTLPTRGVQRIRRTLDILRADLDEVTGAVEAWIPRGEQAQPLFRDETFHDVETTPRGFDVLVARVLLPHEHLGRYYYPELSGAVLISATTWLKGGFDAQSRYLGCWRAANPSDDEERVGTPLSTFRAPDAFDYSRVLVCAPRDAPAPNAGKRAALEYVARFACYLGERTRGRILVLFTNADDCAQAAKLAEPFFTARRIPFWHQRMEGTVKEELSERFRSTVDSVMFGLDTFWYGADFPGETLEHLVIARLPYGVPDRYHHAQCAVLGAPEQRKQIYMPRALAKFRQGFGRLMRKESDRGCVYLLDPRILDPRHRTFLRELPLSMPELGEANPDPEGGGARLVRGDAERCFREAFAHMGLTADLKRRMLDQGFGGWRADQPGAVAERPSIDETELPF